MQLEFICQSKIHLVLQYFNVLNYYYGLNTIKTVLDLKNKNKNA